MHALQTCPIWRFGADLSALFDWVGVSAVLVVAKRKPAFLSTLAR